MDLTKAHSSAQSPGERSGPTVLNRLLAPGNDRVWLLNLGIWIVAAVCIAWLVRLGPVSGFSLSVSWWWLAVGFFVAELMVVHLQFRDDAHTFSMSEVPMTLGLLMAAPVGLFLGQIVGSVVALGIFRRQRMVKLFFNLGQLILQMTAAVAVFRSISGSTVGLDAQTVFALVAAMMAALFVGHAAVLAAIRASGGTETLKETMKVFAISSAGTFAATLLGVVAVVTLVEAPGLFWVGLVPVLLIFVAYRAYVAQVHEKDRVEALFDAAVTLHRTPQIERAVESVATRVLDLVKAEAAAVILFPTHDEPTAWVTLVDSSGTRRLMSERPLTASAGIWAIAPASGRRILRGVDATKLEDLVTEIEVRQAVVHGLSSDGQPVGLVAGINRLGEVSSFGDRDLQVLATLGSQLSTTLANSRLTDTLSDLRALKSELEAVIESKDQLVASVSHELRTPLTSVVGLAAIVREAASELDEETLEMLDLIVDQGNELSNIIEDLLTHARVEAGTLSVRPEVFDLGAEVMTLATTNEIEVVDNGYQLLALADPLRVRQILRNLITNARRYGGPSMRLVLGGETEAATVAVVDDGQGVSEGQEEAIFQAYKSAHRGSGQPGSVGLGLALSRSMARMMGGDLTYSRTDGETWFVLSLPTVRTPVHQ